VEQIVKVLEILMRTQLKAKDEGFHAFQSDDGGWGVEQVVSHSWGSSSGIVYESDLGFTQFQAELISLMLNLDDSLDWDDIAPLIESFDVNKKA